MTEHKIQVGDADVEFDQDGFMLEPGLWNDAVARAIGREEDIDEMSEDQIGRAHV